MLPYRVRVGDKSGSKEFGVVLDGDGGEDIDEIAVQFDDGTVTSIASVTKGQYAAQLAMRGKKRAEKLWEGERVSCHHRLTLEQRCDRVLLVALYEQSAQVLQLRADLWGPLPSPQPAVVDNSDDTIQKVRAFALPLCLAYASGEIASPKELKEKRNIMMKEQAIVGKRVPKRLAGTMTSTKSSNKKPASEALAVSATIASSEASPTTKTAPMRKRPAACLPKVAGNGKRLIICV